MASPKARQNTYIRRSFGACRLEVVQDTEGYGFKPNCFIRTIEVGWTLAIRPNSCSVLLELMSE
jgi:hypothetical protein